MESRGVWATVDPGKMTAIALWDRDWNMLSIEQQPIETPAGAYSFAKFFLIKHKYIEKFIIERVEIWASSSKSMASATSGDLSKLAYIVGALSAAIETQKVPVELISPLKWKGQMNYKQLRNILLVKFGIKTTSDHKASAIGIGLHLKGVL
jgi:hypothetical protein